MSIFDIPAGASVTDPQWQTGYGHGFNVEPPRSIDPVYVSGWCHGWCAAYQTTREEAVEAYGLQQDTLARPAE